MPGAEMNQVIAKTKGLLQTYRDFTKINSASQVRSVSLASEMVTLVLSLGLCGSVCPVDTLSSLGSISTDHPHNRISGLGHFLWKKK